jgi:hypothetical protein
MTESEEARSLLLAYGTIAEYARKYGNTPEAVFGVIGTTYEAMKYMEKETKNDRNKGSEEAGDGSSKNIYQRR